MKKILTILTIVALALFIVACAKPATPPTQTPPTTGGQEPTDQPAGKCIPKTCPSGQVQSDTNCECFNPNDTLCPPKDCPAGQVQSSVTCECHAQTNNDAGNSPETPDFDFGQDESNDLGSLGGK